MLVSLPIMRGIHSSTVMKGGKHYPTVVVFTILLRCIYIVFWALLGRYFYIKFWRILNGWLLYIDSTKDLSMPKVICEVVIYIFVFIKRSLVFEILFKARWVVTQELWIFNEHIAI